MVVETRYVPMEEIAKHFDGEQADVAVVATGKTADMEVSHVEVTGTRKADV